MDDITIFYTSVDGVRERRAFKDRDKARAYAVKMIGENPEIGSNYAVAGDGIGKIEAWGITIKALFAAPAVGPNAYPFQVWFDVIDEDAGTSRAAMAKAFATLEAATEYVQEIAAYSDGVTIKATTAAAQDELDAAIEAAQ